MDHKLRIVIADDHPLSRAGLRQVIESKSDFDVVSEEGDGKAALEAIRKLKPAAAVLDINMPKMDGLGGSNALREESLEVPVVILTRYHEQKIVNRALAVGAKGYVLKDSAATDIVNCLNAVVAGQHYISPDLTSYLIQRSHSQ